MWILHILKVVFRSSRILSALTIALNLAAALIPMAQVMALAALIDAVVRIHTSGFPVSGIVWPLLAIISLLILNMFSEKINNFIKAGLINRLRIGYMPELTDKRAKLEYKYIENPDSLDLISRVLQKPEEWIYDSFSNLIKIASLFITIISLASVIIYYMWYIGLSIVIIAAPLMAVAVRGGKATYEANKKATKYVRKREYFSEILLGREAYLERFIFGYGPELTKTWRENFEIARGINFKTTAVWIVKSSVSGIFSVFIYAVIVCFLLYMAIHGTITIGIFMALVNAVYQLTRSMTFDLAWTMEALVKNREYIKETNTFLSMGETPGSIDKPSSTPLEFESLEFKNVSFKYPNTEAYILKGLSFTIDKGRHYSFVGVNGAGKSTIIKLIAGLYNDYEGEILLNGWPLKNYSYASLKSVCAVAFQDFCRYFISIRDNVALGNINSMENDDVNEEVFQALDILNMTGFVNGLPDGINTNLGKIKAGGIDVSGGEWQRFALARFCANPGTLRILDEPTAALDPVSESRFMRNSRNYQRIRLRCLSATV